MYQHHLVLVAAVLAGAALVGCAPSGTSDAATSTSTSTAASPTSASGDDAPLSEGMARKEFEQRCATCHGNGGKGDGPGAANLTPKPRDYTDKTWQQSVTDDQIRKTILMGGAAVGKSPNMPASPDLESKPRVVDALVKHVRKFGQ